MSDEYVIAPEDLLEKHPIYQTDPVAQRDWTVNSIRITARRKNKEVTLLEINEGPFRIQLSKFPRVVPIFTAGDAPAGALLTGNSFAILIDKEDEPKLVSLGYFVSGPDGTSLANDGRQNLPVKLAEVKEEPENSREPEAADEKPN